MQLTVNELSLSRLLELVDSYEQERKYWIWDRSFSKDERNLYMDGKIDVAERIIKDLTELINEISRRPK